MLNEIRKTAITIIVAITVAAAALAASASAAPTTGGGTTTKWQSTCADAQISFENAITLTEGQAEMGDKAGAAKSIKLAQNIRDNANASGCKVS